MNIDLPGFSVRTIECDGYIVIVTSGGISVKGKEGWDFTCRKVKSPKNMNNKELLQRRAKQAVKEYKEFVEECPAIKNFDAHLYENKKA
jgi:hypothetical protein